MPTQLKFFIDFDGTISKTDVIDAILENFADPSWKAIESEWASGKIGSRECLTRQLELVQATTAQFGDLVDGIEVDPYFLSFIRRAHALQVPVIIVSDGLTEVIRRVLARVFLTEPVLLRSLTVHANHLRWDAKGPRLVHSDGSCEHGCANCKVAVIKGHSAPGDCVAFVGDGLSDRFAAGAATLTFAKSKLAAYCAEKQIKHIVYNDFREIEHWLVEQKGSECATPKKSF